MSGRVDAPRAPPAGDRIRRLLPADWAGGVCDALAVDGVVILAGAAIPTELAVAEALFFRFLGQAGFHLGNGDGREGGGNDGHRQSRAVAELVRQCRDDRWRVLGRLPTGQVASHGIAHSAFMWHCRGLPGVRRAFQEVWQCDQLATSFDVAGTARNLYLAPAGEDWRTVGEWYHVDQNGNTHPGLETVRDPNHFTVPILIPPYHHIYSHIPHAITLPFAVSITSRGGICKPNLPYM